MTRIFGSHLAARAGFVFGLALGIVGVVQAQSIFNLSNDPAPASSQGQTPSMSSTQVSVPAMEQSDSNQVGQDARAPVRDYAPVTPPAASALPTIKALNVDPHALDQFDRGPDETDDAYVARMKGVYEREKEAAQRADQRNLTILRNLSPDEFYKNPAARRAGGVTGSNGGVSGSGN